MYLGVARIGKTPKVGFIIDLLSIDPGESERERGMRGKSLREGSDDEKRDLGSHVSRR